MHRTANTLSMPWTFTDCFTPLYTTPAFHREICHHNSHRSLVPYRAVPIAGDVQQRAAHGVLERIVLLVMLDCIRLHGGVQGG